MSCMGSQMGPQISLDYTLKPYLSMYLWKKIDICYKKLGAGRIQGFTLDDFQNYSGLKYHLKNAMELSPIKSYYLLLSLL